MIGKKELRQELLRRRKGFRASLETLREITQRLLRLPELFQANAINSYVAVGGEVDLTMFAEAWLELGRTLFLPRFDASEGNYKMVAVHDLERDLLPEAHYGIPEPRPELPVADRTSRAAAWLVPGVAFDFVGRRLGRGGGHYDRLLAGTSGCRIGIAWDWQLREQLPEESHDMRMDMVVTEQQTIRKKAACEHSRIFDRR